MAITPTPMGHGQKVMFSAFEKESAYDGGVTMISDKACSMNGFTAGTTWDDDVQTDGDEITGSEYATEQTIVEKRVSFTHGQPKAKPNDLAFMAALTMGAVSSVQDAATTAWTHTITPAALGTEMPSVQGEQLIGAVQYAYKGIKSNSIKISGEAGGIVNIESALAGSGTRATSATAFAAKIAESWMLWNQCKVWAEDGSDITIVAAGSLVQDAENISSASPDDLKILLKTFEINYLNNYEMIPGFGGLGVLQDQQIARRTTELTFALRFSGQADFDRYINQNMHAIEFNLTGALIDDGNSLLDYGAILIVPAFKILKAPVPQAGPGDSIEASFETTVMDDGTNAPFFMQVYNAQTAYLA